MSRLPSIYSLVNPAPYLVNLEEEDDDDDYYLQAYDNNNEHLSLDSPPQPYPSQSGPHDAVVVEDTQSSDEDLDSLHGAYASNYGVYGVDGGDSSDSVDDSIGQGSSLQLQSSVASPSADDSDLISSSIAPSLSLSPVSPAASPSTPGWPDSQSSSGWPESASVSGSGSAVDMDLDLDVDLDLNLNLDLGSDLSAPASELEPASASFLDTPEPDRDPHRRSSRQPQVINDHDLPRRVSATPDIRPSRRRPGHYSHQHQHPQPRPVSPLITRRSRANYRHRPPYDLDPANEFELHRNPYALPLSNYFPAQSLEPSEIDDIHSQFDHLVRPEISQYSSPRLDPEDQEEGFPPREHLRLRRARRAARAAREAERPGSGRGSGALRAHRSLGEGWDSFHPEESEDSAQMNNMDNLDMDDELVEVVFEGAVPAPPTPPRRQQQRNQRQQRRGNDVQNVDVIDLTEEPDSPELRRHQPVNLLRHRPQGRSHDDSHPHQNPRRQMSQNGRTPSLNRSDGSFLNNYAAVIDLTVDSPDDNIPANRRLPRPAPAPVQRDQHNHLFGRNLMGSIRGLLPGLLTYGQIREADIQFIGANPAIPMNPNPLAGNPPDFNYQANGFGLFGGGRQPTPKPDFEAPPAARPGFTRDTGPDKDTGEEQVFVCPSCDNELKYSAEEDEEDGNSGRPAKRARTKKDREEHHFWAVKACGHVYCKSCYDNRKKHSKGKDSAAAKTGFQFQPSETARSVKIFCAVDDCQSEVSPNNAWVGIFM
ncbi:hypothetical protein SLS53_008339 [Cytospora paraplurivora]|uniref:Cell cycle control protein n=1 Tax=Cytospora paraplurivora TaxID=2898453 RepID=A0AAN9TYD2_9PEZI